MNSVLAFLAAIVLFGMIGCTEGPTSVTDDGNEIVDNGVLAISGSRLSSREVLVTMKVSRDLFVGSPDSVCAVGIFGNWVWEKDAESDPDGDNDSQYVIETVVEPGIYYFNLKGPGRIGWAKLDLLEQSEYWLWYDEENLVGWIVISVQSDGDIETMSSRAFELWLKDDPSDTGHVIINQGAQRDTITYVDTVFVQQIGDTSLLITQPVIIITNRTPSPDTVYVRDTVNSTQYVVVTRVILDTITNTVVDTFDMPGDTIWLPQDTIVLNDTIRVPVKSVISVARYQAGTTAGTGVYDLSFKWSSAIGGTQPFVAGVPDWDQFRNLTIAYGDTAKGIRVTLEEGKTYTAGYGANSSGAWALIPCDDPLAYKPANSQYCLLKFIPWQGKLYTEGGFVMVNDTVEIPVDHYDTVIVVDKDTVIVVQRDTLQTRDTLWQVRTDTITIVVTNNDTVTNTVTVYDTITVVHTNTVTDTVWSHDTVFIPTPIVADTSWSDTVRTSESGSIIDTTYLPPNDLLAEIRTQPVLLVFSTITTHAVTGGDTTVTTSRDTTATNAGSATRDTIDFIVVPLIVLDGGNGEYRVTIGVHEDAFIDTVGAANLAMVGNPYTGAIAGANPDLDWSSGIQSELTKRNGYFQFELMLAEGDTLPQFNFRHINGSWTTQTNVLSMSTKFRDSFGFGIIFRNEELVPLY